MENANTKKNTPFYKNWIFWLCVVLVVITTVVLLWVFVFKSDFEVSKNVSADIITPAVISDCGNGVSCSELIATDPSVCEKLCLQQDDCLGFVYNNEDEICFFSEEFGTTTDSEGTDVYTRNGGVYTPDVETDTPWDPTTEAPTFEPTTEAPTFEPTTEAPTEPPFPDPIVALDFTFASDLGKDSSGYNNNFTNNGAIVVGDGVDGGNAISIDNQKSVLANTGDILSFDRFDKFSIFMWFKKTENVYGYVVDILAIMNKMDGPMGIDIYNIGSKMFINFSNSSSNRIGTVSENIPAINDLNWHHFGFTYNGSSNANGIKYYFDGQPAESVIHSDSLTNTITNNNKFKITAHSLTNYDDFRAYNTELTPNQVNELYNSYV